MAATLLRITAAVAFVALALSCSDGSSSCTNWVKNGFCSNSFYTTAQKAQYCGASCSLCSVTSASATCSDLNTNCATWVSNGFCTNTAYTDAQKAQYCPSSCNMCVTSTGATSTATATTGDTSTTGTTGTTGTTDTARQVVEKAKRYLTLIFMEKL
ncbi:unnamed protein product, partial [Mesorhabditis belari]|uniref:ShKT domain-containing protein n=1 Tax=Mesorhabditis belari TaxID=2138241 RepID=A0AAF3FLE3_9BILA